MSGLAVLVGILAMVVSRGRVLLGLIVSTVVVMMGRLAVMVSRSFVVGRCVVMVFTGRMFQFVGHVRFL